MKKIIFIFVFVLVNIITAGAQSFSGVILFETENTEVGEKSTITCYIKPHVCKMEIKSSTKDGNSSYTLYFDDQKPDVTMVSGGTKTTIALSSLPANKYLENILVVVPTGKNENIAGYNATEVNMKSTNASIRCLVAAELNIEFPSVLNSKGMMKALKENNISGVPVLMEVKDLTGKLMISQKITSVRSENLSDSIFSVE